MQTWMLFRWSSPRHYSGKRQCQSLDAAGHPLPRTTYVLNSVNPTFFVNDCPSGRKYLVDSGAAVSVFPAPPEDKIHLPANYDTLSAANGSIIRSYGKRIIPLGLSSVSLSFNPEFILAEVHHPILGADFFQRERVGIDLWRRQLWNLDGPSLSGGQTGEAVVNTIFSVISSIPGDNRKILPPFCGPHFTVVGLTFLS